MPLKKDPKKASRLIVISAPSGAGKTTLCDLLLKDYSSITLSISATTRKKRPYEIEDVHYFFLSPEAFQKKIDHGEFAEWAEVHGNRYGTLKSTIEKAAREGKHLLFDIDVQGAMSLEKLYPEKVLTIFIHPPSIEILEQRLRDRKGDSPEVIEKRVRNAYNELKWSSKFKYQLVNDELKRVYNELKQIVEKECA